jgi:DNA-binding SARP family transcriptional activator
MARWNVRLFGRLSVERDGIAVADALGGKARELVCCLLADRARPRRRDALAVLLWPDHPDDLSRKYLRQALWQVQAATDGSRGDGRSGRPLLEVAGEWVGVARGAEVVVDVEVFEEAYRATSGLLGRDLDAAAAARLDGAVALYRGEVFDGLDAGWCAPERERLHLMRLAMLDKLLAHAEGHGAYEDAILHGLRILAVEPARERTHRALMRLHDLAGDRSAALAQYARCVDALDRDLGVAPSDKTRAVYTRLREGRPATEAPPALALPRHDDRAARGDGGWSPAALASIEVLWNALTTAQRQLAEDVAGIEGMLGRGGLPSAGAGQEAGRR